MDNYPNQLLDMDRVFILQAAIVVAGMILGLALGKELGAPARIGKILDRLTARPWLPPVIVGLVAFAGSALVSNTVRWPVPSVHDEFGYLLIADTFHHGRLANPTPEHWEHFEVIHTIMRPTYQSKFPPGTGAMIWLGTVVSNGKAAVGLWLGVALACSATTWLLQALVTTRWALIGGLLAALHFGFFSAWSQTFWGGATAMLGGAMMLGATARLANHGPSVAMSAVLGAGLFILSFTRPYEGLVASIPIGAWLLWSLWRWTRDQHARPTALKVLAVQILCALVIIAANGFYNHAVTGSALRMPYMEYQRQYAIVPEFITTGDMQPERRPERFETIAGTTQQFFDSRAGTQGLLSNHLPRMMGSLLWLCSAALLLPILVGVWQLAFMRSGGVLVASFGLTIIAASATFGLWPHYFAPVAAMFIVCATVGMRHLWHCKRTPIGIGRGIAVGAAAALFATAFGGFAPPLRNTEPAFGLTRQSTIRQIRRVKGHHLVLIEYSPQSNPFCDWVYNEADIDNSRIIWATSLGEEKDAELIAKYADRNLWVYDADAWDFRVRPPVPEREENPNAD